MSERTVTITFTCSVCDAEHVVTSETEGASMHEPCRCGRVFLVSWPYEIRPVPASSLFAPRRFADDGEGD